ncbi:MAG: hypothetical protein C5B51_31440 [Terriglobia bacterium]|nr:MAG: hypothetical protein C5B51_31440 [Terriglobia bacterium]
MDVAHLHLLLNHFPTIGFLLGMAVFLLGLAGKSNDLRRAGLILFMGIALLSIPIYISGNGAQQSICDAPPGKPCPDGNTTVTLKAGGAGYTFAPGVRFSGGECVEQPEGNARVDDGAVTGLTLSYLGFGCRTAPAITFSGGKGSGAAAEVNLSPQRTLVSKAMIEEHESSALYSLGLMELTGGFAWLGLWQFRRNSRFSPAVLTAILILSVLTFAAMARTSNLGGQIRHPEVRDTELTAAGVMPAEQSFARKVGEWVAGGGWAFPACETLHFIGLCLLSGIAAIVDLRMLGLIRGVSFRALHRLLPWGILGFGVNLVTGILFFVADPTQYIHGGDWMGEQNATFQWKMIFILLAGLNVLYFTVFDHPWRLEAGDKAPFSARLVAASSLFLVVGIMFCGRMLPFLGGSF